MLRSGMLWGTERAPQFSCCMPGVSFHAAFDEELHLLSHTVLGLFIPL
jgi:hypothetical protein